MVPFIDIHCHLDHIADVSLALDNAQKAGVGVILTNGITPATNRKSLVFAQSSPSVHAALGFYPPDAHDFAFTQEEFEKELEFIRKNANYVDAIGEVGMDFKDGKDKAMQERVFVDMIALSKELDVPLLIHSRKAEKEVLDILEREGAKKAVLHCFSGKKSLVKKGLELGYCFSLPTNIVRSQQFQELAKLAPISQLFCETDSPFLSPYPDTPNEPAFVVESYRKLAEIKGLTLDETKTLIYQNFQRLFR